MELRFMKIPFAGRHLIVIPVRAPAAARKRLFAGFVGGMVIFLLARLLKDSTLAAWLGAVAGFGALLLLSLIVKIDRTVQAELRANIKQAEKQQHGKDEQEQRDTAG